VVYLLIGALTAGAQQDVAVEEADRQASRFPAGLSESDSAVVESEPFLPGLDVENDTATSVGSGLGSGWLQFLETLVVLGIVLVCICLVIWVIRRFVSHTPMLLDKRVGRVVGRLYLSPKNVIFLVHVADRILVVGTAQNAIECLAEITDPAAVGRIVEGRDTFAGSLDKATQHIAAERGVRRAPASVEDHIEDIGQQLERLKALEEDETETP
jgi:flagellar biogenesis protein FliO